MGRTSNHTRLHHRTNPRSRSTPDLARTLAELAELPDVSDLPAAALHALIGHLGDSSGALWLIETGNIPFAITPDNLDPSNLESAEWEAQYLPWLHTGQVLIHHETDFERAPGYARRREWYRTRGIQSVLVVPLSASGVLLGYVCSHSTRARHYTSADLDVARALTHQAAMAVRVMRSSRQSEQLTLLAERERAACDRAAELGRANAALRRATDRLAADPDLTAFLGHVVAESTLNFEAATGRLTLLDESGSTLAVHLRVEDGRVTPLLEKVPLDSGFFETLREVRQPCGFDLELDADLFWPEALEFHRSRGHRSLAAAPLILAGEMVGHIDLACPRPGRAVGPCLELFGSLAQHATLAVQLTRLANRATQAAVIEERNRLARDIHDTLAQGFAGVLLQLGAAEGRVGQNEAALTHLRTARQLARTSLDEARRSVQALRPLALDRAGLAEALGRSVRQADHDSPHTDFTLTVIGTPWTLPASVEDELLRIAQEAMANACRHADAQHVTVLLRFCETGDGVRLDVQDNGRGFDADRPTNGDRFGLVGMYERAARIGAVLTIASEPGRGTEVIVAWTPTGRLA
jgi:signal transduction histidine kinase